MVLVLNESDEPADDRAYRDGAADYLPFELKELVDFAIDLFDSLYEI